MSVTTSLQDFLTALPVRCYTEPCLGGSALNVATALKPRDNPTDLGPKCYIAYGRVAEAQGEGDSVTKVHNDMTGGWRQHMVEPPMHWMGLFGGGVKCTATCHDGCPALQQTLTSFGNSHRCSN